jgi:hypothetical protein
MKYFYRLIIAIIMTPIIIPFLWIALIFNKGQILDGVNNLPIFSFLWSGAELD